MNNDIVTKARLNAALGTEGNMGFEHNDIVTVDKMNEAIAEGGGGGSSDLSTASVTLNVTDNVEVSGFFLLTPVSVYEDTTLESGTYNLILAYGKARVEFVTKEPITMYSGDVHIAETKEDGGLYYTKVVIVGDCSITLVGSNSN